jgi:fatty acid synthase
MLPSNSLVIEIAPSAIFQAIFKRNLPNGIHIGMGKPDNQDNVPRFLSALGRFVLDFSQFRKLLELLFVTIRHPRK